MERILCIVSRRHPDLFAYLKQRFPDPVVTVILDRRLEARRRQTRVVAEERRRAERRRRPDVDDQLGRRSHVIIRMGEVT
jgi:hypothetical protein